MSPVQVKYAGPNRRLKNRRANLKLRTPNRRLENDRRQSSIRKLMQFKGI